MTSTSINPRTAHTNDRRAAADERHKIACALSRIRELCRELNGDGSGEAAQLVADANALAGRLEALAHKAIGARLSAAQKSNG